MAYTEILLLSAVCEVIPSLHAAVAQSPAGQPPPPARRPDAVRTLLKRHRPDSGAGPGILEERIYQRKSGCR